MSAFQMLVYNISGNDTVADTNMVVGLDFEAEDEAWGWFHEQKHHADRRGETQVYFEHEVEPTTHNIPTTAFVMELSMCGINLMASARSYAWPTSLTRGRHVYSCQGRCMIA